MCHGSQFQDVFKWSSLEDLYLFSLLFSSSNDTMVGVLHIDSGVFGKLRISVTSLISISAHRFWSRLFHIGIYFSFQIGVWKSWEKEGLDIKDIVWPGNSHTPPQGVPEKFHLKITFLEEPPYINLAPPDPVTGKCSMDRGVLCRVASDADITEWVAESLIAPFLLLLRIHAARFTLRKLQNKQPLLLCANQSYTQIFRRKSHTANKFI